MILSTSSSRAVSIRMGTSEVLRIRRQTSMPSMSGSIRSRIVSAGGSDETWSSASAPLATVRTEYPAFFRYKATKDAIELSSSTMRIDSEFCAIPSEDATTGGRYSATGLEIRTLVGLSGIRRKPSSQKLSSSTEYLPAMSWLNPLTESTALPLPATLRSTDCAFTVSLVGPAERKRTLSAGPYVQTWSFTFVGMTPGTLGRLVTPSV